MLTSVTSYVKQTNANIIRVHLIELSIGFLQRSLNLIPKDSKPNENGNTGKSTDDAANLIKIKISSEKFILCFSRPG